MPAELGFRKLYRTPRAYVYASSQSAADWGGTYLREELGEIERRCDVELERGLVVVLAPGESVTARRPGTREPLLPMTPSYEPGSPETSCLVLGLPSSIEGAYQWWCVLPSDRHLREGVSRHQRNAWRQFREEHPRYFAADDALGRITYICVLRVIAVLWKDAFVEYASAHRKYILAGAAIRGSCQGEGLDRARGILESHYKQQYVRLQREWERIGVH